MKIKRPESKQPLPNNAKRVFIGKIFDVYQWKQKMFDGSYQTFEKLIRPDTVMVIPITKDGQVILTEQKQPGKRSFVGLAGGRVDKGEGILDAAKRELLEETGYVAKRYELFDATQSISKIEWVVYTFIAKDCKKVSEPDLDSGEKIQVNLVSLDEFFEIILTPRYQDSEILWRLQKNDVLKLKYDKIKLAKLKKSILN